ncbi:MAG: helix-turn-helix transcriptional regulator, partial [Bacteroidales bacterium]
MEHFGLVIRRLRESKELPLREVSTALNIDQAVISKLERRQRAATVGQVGKLADFYQVPLEELMTHWLSDKIALSLKGQQMALEALDMARQKVLSQAREDFSRESVFHQVYHVCRKNSFSRVWVFGPFAEEKNILSRQLSVLI